MAYYPVSWLRLTQGGHRDSISAQDQSPSRRLEQSYSESNLRFLKCPRGDIAEIRAFGITAVPDRGFAISDLRGASVAFYLPICAVGKQG